MQKINLNIFAIVAACAVLLFSACGKSPGGKPPASGGKVSAQAGQDAGAGQTGFAEGASLENLENADVYAKDENGATALHRAAEAGRKDPVKIILSKGADINARDAKGLVALHYAVKNGRKDVVELLLANNADVNAADDENGMTPFHLASAENMVEIAGMLVKKGVHAMKDKYGQTPVHLAYSAEMLKVLVDAGCGVNEKDIQGLTSLHRAAIEGRKNEIISMLILSGADVGALDDVNGWSPFHWAVYQRRKGTAEFLLSVGAVVDVRSRDNDTPLYLAAREGAEEYALWLLQKGANINTKCSGGRTPLHVAISTKSVRMTGVLLKGGADAYIQCSEGKTPLHYAVISGVKEIVQLLLNRGVYVNVKDNGGSTPLKYADVPEIAELLRKRGAE